MAALQKQIAHGLAARDSSGVLIPFEFPLRQPSPTDVVIKVMYCGIDHTDLHQTRNEFRGTVYPIVPGHEITGIVTLVGPRVTKFKVGDRVGVGSVVGSCRKCETCNEGFENYCEKLVMTYNSSLPDGTHTYGGYADTIVVDQDFVLGVPANLPLDVAAPLMCSGITVYSSLKFYGATEAGKSLGVVGLGGVGHMAIKFGKAFGMKVTVISTSPSKEKEAIEVLGADSFILSKDPEQMMAAAKSLHFIIDTVSAQHDIKSILNLLNFKGKLILVGAPEEPLPLPSRSLLLARRVVGGSYSGGIKETQEMLDFCGSHNVAAIVETVGMESVNQALKRLEKSDIKYRFVINVAGC